MFSVKRPFEQVYYIRILKATLNRTDRNTYSKGHVESHWS